MNAYNPYPYNPTLSKFYVTGNYSELPDDAFALARAKPEVANHVDSVWKFSEWLKKTDPHLHAALAEKKPQLLNPASAVSSGALSKGAPLRGMGDFNPTESGYGNEDIPTVYLDGSSTTASTPQTSWGSDILGAIKEIAPAYLQLRAQNSLINVNIARAERGLPPIDAGSISPQVNVGVSKDVQMLGYLAIGGLVLFGLASAFAKSR